MGCRYSDFRGKCTLCDESYYGFNPKGAYDGDCVVEDDPNPLDSCDDYEDEEEEEVSWAYPWG